MASRSQPFRVTHDQSFWVALAVAVLCLAMSFVSETFATSDNFFNVTRNFAFIGLMALGQTAQHQYHLAIYMKKRQKGHGRLIALFHKRPKRHHLLLERYHIVMGQHGCFRQASGSAGIRQDSQIRSRINVDVRRLRWIFV